MPRLLQVLQQPYLIWWVFFNFSLTFFPHSPPPPLLPSHYSGLRCSHFRGNHWVKCRKNTRSHAFSYFSVNWANLWSSYGKTSEVRATYSCLEHLSWLPNAKPEFSKESNTDMKSLWMISHRNRHSLVQVIITIFSFDLGFHQFVEILLRETGNMAHQLGESANSDWLQRQLHLQDVPIPVREHLFLDLLHRFL